LHYAAKLEGNAAEVGVYKGGSAKMIAQILHHKKVYLFEAFKGLPKPDRERKDYLPQGAFADITEASIKDFLKEHANIEWRVGWFPNTAEGLIDTFCFVHVDCDLYAAVKSCCEFFHPKMSKGGVMIFDDYGYELTGGAKTAVDEYFGKNNVIYLGDHAIVIC
jgi:hypothetical protein